MNLETKIELLPESICVQKNQLFLSIYKKNKKWTAGYDTRTAYSGIGIYSTDIDIHKAIDELTLKINKESL